MSVELEERDARLSQRPPVSEDSSSDDNPVVVRAHGVTKFYKIYHNFITGPIKERLLFWQAEKYYRKFPAVQGVSLEIKRGQVVGVVGPNGSGKTTLLKGIAGLLAIDEGSIEVHGKVTALLSQAVGVHPEFSGRENIYFGALMLGMTREEIGRKIDDIIAFAELGQYIDNPFRTYSSGMRARLLFSISMSIEPEILIIDEALSAGDAYFVRKCRQRLREICSSGATVIFVSHDPTQVEELCDHAILMIGGQILSQGSPSDIVRQYYDWTFNKEKGVAATGHTGTLNRVGGNGVVAIEEVLLLDKSGAADTGFYAGEPMTIRLRYRCPDGPVPQVGVFCGILLRPQNQYVAELESSWHVDPDTGRERETAVDLQAAGYIDLQIKPLLLINNTYSLWLKLYTKQERGHTQLCEYRDVAPFFVSRRAHSLSRGPMFWLPFHLTSGPLE